jgi:hypothetical protein
MDAYSPGKPRRLAGDLAGLRLILALQDLQDPARPQGKRTRLLLQTERHCPHLKAPRKQKPRGRLWLNDGSCIRLRPQHRNHVWSYDFVEAHIQTALPADRESAASAHRAFLIKIG